LKESNMAKKPTRSYALSSALVASVAVLLPAAVSAQHFSGWTAASPVNEVNVPIFNDGCPIETPDGLRLFTASNRVGTFGGNDIWVTERASEDAPWGTPENIGPAINGTFNDFCPTPLPGDWLLFVSERPVAAPCSTGAGSGDIYITHKHPVRGWEAPQHLGCVANGDGPNTSGPEFSPSLVETAEGTFLFFSSNGGAGGQDIYVSRLGDDGRFSPPAVVAELSTPADDRMPNVSKDGLEIVFSSSRTSWGGGQIPAGGQDVYTSRRDSVTGLWSDPVNVTAANTAGGETRATMSRDRVRLYFGRDGDVFVSTRDKLTGTSE
jgi:WD40-like Beta Propeller Repeat